MVGNGVILALASVERVVTVVVSELLNNMLCDNVDRNPVVTVAIDKLVLESVGEIIGVPTLLAETLGCPSKTPNLPTPALAITESLTRLTGIMGPSSIEICLMAAKTVALAAVHGVKVPESEETWLTIQLRPSACSHEARVVLLTTNMPAPPVPMLGYFTFSKTLPSTNTEGSGYIEKA